MAVDRDIQALKKELAVLREELRSMRKSSPASSSTYGISMPNETRIAFLNTSDVQGAFLYMSGDDDAILGNVTHGKQIVLIAYTSGGSEKVCNFSADDGDGIVEFEGVSGLRLIASGTTAPIKLLCSGDITIDADGAILMPSIPTSNPTNAGEVFRSGNDLQISTG